MQSAEKKVAESISKVQQRIMHATQQRTALRQQRHNLLVHRSTAPASSHTAAPTATASQQSPGHPAGTGPLPQGSVASASAAVQSAVQHGVPAVIAVAAAALAEAAIVAATAIVKASAATGPSPSVAAGVADVIGLASGLAGRLHTATTGSAQIVGGDNESKAGFARAYANRFRAFNPDEAEPCKLVSSSISSSLSEQCKSRTSLLQHSSSLQSGSASQCCAVLYLPYDAWYACHHAPLQRSFSISPSVAPTY